MTLISLLLVLAAERIATRSKLWSYRFYTTRYSDTAEDKGWITESNSNWALLALILAPALFLFLFQQQIDNALAEFVVSTAVLMVCIGCPDQRECYKHYLQAANRGDLQACSMHADELGHIESDGNTFGQTLVWVNFKHYAAVVLWFIVLGAAGAVLYTLARTFQSVAVQKHPQVVSQLDYLMAFLDWVPVRITALGFLLVGHFSRAFPIWLGHLLDPKVSARVLLSSVAKAAEEVEPDEKDCTEEPCTLVRLAKRNMIFILAIISLLTLTGWLS